MMNRIAALMLAVGLSCAAEARLALIFGGDGTENDDPTGTLYSAVRAAQAAGFDTRVITESVDDADWARADLWIQPGGPNFHQAYHMQRTGIFDKVREFVRAGGGYVGFCGGAYMGQSYASLGLGLMPGMAYKHGEYTHKTPVMWNGRLRYLHFEHGPELARGPGIEVFATYEWNGAPAAARSRFGQGKVVLSGPHPEAMDDWEPFEDPDGPDLDLAIEMIREVAR